MKNNNLLTKVIAILVVASFTYSFILAEPALGIASVVQERAEHSRMKGKLDAFTIPYSHGRITGGMDTGSSSLVVYIQDLHCNPEVQRNINGLLALLDNKYGVRKIFIEGAPRGKVDTELLSSLPDDKLRKLFLDTLIDKGILSGAEYFSVLNGRENLYGLENWDTYLSNFACLKDIINNKQANLNIASELERGVSHLRDRYLSQRVKNLEGFLLRKHKDPGYYRKLAKLGRKHGVDLTLYPNLARYVALQQLGRRLNMRRVSREMQAYSHELRGRMPYTAYQKLAELMHDKDKMEEYCAALAETSDTYTPDAILRYPELGAFLRYVRLNYAISPVQMVREERVHARHLLRKHANTMLDKELLFLADMVGHLKRFLALEITPDEYEYFTENAETFAILLKKYQGAETSSKVGELIAQNGNAAFFKTNLRRNDIFCEAIRAGLDKTVHARAGARVSGEAAFKLKGYASVLEHIDAYEHVYVVVAGGFHTDITGTLNDLGISYLTITPQAGRQDNTSIYERFVTDTVDIGQFLQEAFAILFSAASSRDLAPQTLQAVICELVKVCMTGGNLNVEDINAWLKANDIDVNISEPVSGQGKTIIVVQSESATGNPYSAELIFDGKNVVLGDVIVPAVKAGQNEGVPKHEMNDVSIHHIVERLFDRFAAMHNDISDTICGHDLERVLGLLSGLLCDSELFASLSQTVLKNNAADDDRQKSVRTVSETARDTFISFGIFPTVTTALAAALGDASVPIVLASSGAALAAGLLLGLRASKFHRQQAKRLAKIAAKIGRERRPIVNPETIAKLDEHIRFKQYPVPVIHNANLPPDVAARAVGAHTIELNPLVMQELTPQEQESMLEHEYRHVQFRKNHPKLAKWGWLEERMVSWGDMQVLSGARMQARALAFVILLSVIGMFSPLNVHSGTNAALRKPPASMQADASDELKEKIGCLIKELRDGYSFAGEKAVEELAKIGAAHPDAQVTKNMIVPELIKGLGDDYWAVRMKAAEGLGQIAVLQLKTHDTAQVVVHAITKGMGDKHPKVREISAEALVTIASALPEAQITTEVIVPALIKGMEDDPWKIREKIIEGLGKVSAANLNAQITLQAIIPALIKGADDEHWNVREDSVNALVRFGSALPDAEVTAKAIIPELIKRLGDVSSYVRKISANGLIGIVTARKDACENGSIKDETSGLIKQLGASDKPLRRSLIDKLGYIGASHPDANITSQMIVPVLIKSLQENDEYIRWKSAETLVNLGAARLYPTVAYQEIIPALIKGLWSEDQIVRGKSAEVIGRIGAVLPNADASENIKEEIDSLVKRLYSADEYWKRVIAGALATISKAYPGAQVTKMVVIPALIRILGDIGAAHPDEQHTTQGIIPALITALRDKDDGFRRASADALGRIGASSPNSQVTKQLLIPALIKASGDVDFQVRWNSSEALVQIDPANLHESLLTKAIVPALIKGMTEDRMNIDRRSIAALAAIGAVHPDAPATAQTIVPTLIKGLGDARTHIRGNFAAGLAKIGSTHPVARVTGQAIMPALIRGMMAADSSVRLESAAGLANIGAGQPNAQVTAQSIVPALIGGVESSDDQVRRKSAEGLIKIGAAQPESQVVTQVIVPKLVEELGKVDLDFRAELADGLVEIGAARPDAQVTIQVIVPALIKGMRDADWRGGEVREKSTEGLVKIGVLCPDTQNTTQEILPALIKGLGSNDFDVKRLSTQGLINIVAALKGQAFTEKAAVHALIKALGDNNAYIREGSAGILAEISTSDPEGPLTAQVIVPAFVKVLENEEWYVREESDIFVDVTKDSQPTDKEIIPVLTSPTLLDERSVAADAFVRIKATGSDYGPYIQQLAEIVRYRAKGHRALTLKKAIDCHTWTTRTEDLMLLWKSLEALEKSNVAVEGQFEFKLNQNELTFAGQLGWQVDEQGIVSMAHKEGAFARMLLMHLEEAYKNKDYDRVTTLELFLFKYAPDAVKVWKENKLEAFKPGFRRDMKILGLVIAAITVIGLVITSIRARMLARKHIREIEAQKAARKRHKKSINTASDTARDTIALAGILPAVAAAIAAAFCDFSLPATLAATVGALASGLLLGARASRFHRQQAKRLAEIAAKIGRERGPTVKAEVIAKLDELVRLKQYPVSVIYNADLPPDVAARAVGTHTIELNPLVMQELTPQEQESVLEHEYRHVQFRNNHPKLARWGWLEERMVSWRDMYVLSGARMQVRALAFVILLSVIGIFSPIDAQSVAKSGSLSPDSQAWTQDDASDSIKENIAQWIKELDHGHYYTRWNSVGALQGICKDHPSAEVTTQVVVPALIKVMGSEDPIVRRESAEGLAIFGASRPDAQVTVQFIVPVLIKRFEDEEELVRRISVEGLGKIGAKLPDAQVTVESIVPALINKLGDCELSVRHAASQALDKVARAYANSTTQVIVSTLLKGMDSEDANVRERTAEGLGIIGGARTDAQVTVQTIVPALIKGVGSESNLVRMKSVEGLGKITIKHTDAQAMADSIIPALIKGLGDEDQLVREYSARALGDIGIYRREARLATQAIVPALINGMYDDSVNVRVVSADKLSYIWKSNQVKSFTMSFYDLTTLWQMLKVVGDESASTADWHMRKLYRERALELTTNLYFILEPSEAELAVKLGGHVSDKGILISDLNGGVLAQVMLMHLEEAYKNKDYDRVTVLEKFLFKYNENAIQEWKQSQLETFKPGFRRGMKILGLAIAAITVIGLIVTSIRARMLARKHIREIEEQKAARKRREKSITTASDTARATIALAGILPVVAAAIAAAFVDFSLPATLAATVGTLASGLLLGARASRFHRQQAQRLAEIAAKIGRERGPTVKAEVIAKLAELIRHKQYPVPVIYNADLPPDVAARAVGTHTIELNPLVMQELTPQEQESILEHECRHVQFRKNHPKLAKWGWLEERLVSWRDVPSFQNLTRATSQLADATNRIVQSFVTHSSVWLHEQLNGVNNPKQLLAVACILLGKVLTQQFTWLDSFRGLDLDGLLDGLSLAGIVPIIGSLGSGGDSDADRVVAVKMMKFHKGLMTAVRDQKLGRDMREPYEFTRRDRRKWVQFISRFRDELGLTKAFIKGAVYVYGDRMQTNVDEDVFYGLLEGLDLEKVAGVDDGGQDARAILEEARNAVHVKDNYDLDGSAGMRFVDTFISESGGARDPESRKYVPDEESTNLVMIPKTVRDLEKVTQAVHLREPLLLVGQTGVGKTSLIRYLARLTGTNLRRFNLNGQTDKTEFIGGHKPLQKSNPDDKTEFKWNDGILIEAMKYGHWIVLDEINLAEPEIIERIRYLLDPHPRLELSEHSNETWIDFRDYDRQVRQYIEKHRDTGADEEQLIRDAVEDLTRRGIHRIHQDFRLFATMNPSEEEGRKAFSPALMNKFTVKWIKEPSPDEMREILKARFNFGDKLIDKLVDLYVVFGVYSGQIDPYDLNGYNGNGGAMNTAYRKLGRDSGITYCYTIRHLFRLADRIRRFAPRGGDIRFSLLEETEEVYGDGIRSDKDWEIYRNIVTSMLGAVNAPSDGAITRSESGDLISIGGVTIPVRGRTSPLVPGGSAKLDDTPTTVRWLKKLAKCVLMSEKPLLIGPTGAAKTSYLRYLAHLTNNEFLRVNLDAHSDTADLIGTYMPSGSMQWKNGKLLEAMEKGQWLLLDELNLADPDILERVNSLLDDDGGFVVTEKNNEVWLPARAYDKLLKNGGERAEQGMRRIHPDFRMFAAMNPERYSGRNRLSRAMMNKFSEKWISGDISEQELLSIITFYLTDAAVINADAVPDQYVRHAARVIARLYTDIKAMIAGNVLGKGKLSGANAGEYTFSLRDVKDWVRFIRTCRHSRGWDLNRAVVEGALYIFRDRLEGFEDKARFKDDLLKKIDQSGLGGDIIDIDRMDVLEEEGKGVNERIDDPFADLQEHARDATRAELEDILDEFNAFTRDYPDELSPMLSTIRSYLTSSSEDDWIKGIKGLSLLPDEEARTLIGMALRCSSPILVCAALETIGVMHWYSFNDTLFASLKSSNVRIRLTAALVIEHLDDLEYEQEQKSLKKSSAFSRLASENAGDALGIKSFFFGAKGLLPLIAGIGGIYALLNLPLVSPLWLCGLFSAGYFLLGLTLYRYVPRILFNSKFKVINELFRTLPLNEDDFYTLLTPPTSREGRRPFMPREFSETGMNPKSTNSGRIAMLMTLAGAFAAAGLTAFYGSGPELTLGIMRMPRQLFSALLYYTSLGVGSGAFTYLAFNVFSILMKVMGTFQYYEAYYRSNTVRSSFVGSGYRLVTAEEIYGEDSARHFKDTLHAWLQKKEMEDFVSIPPMALDRERALKDNKVSGTVEDVLIDNVALSKRKGHRNTFIPSLANAKLINTVSTVRNMKKVALSLLLDEASLLVGESGVGKTSVIRYISALAGWSFRRVNLSGQTDKTQLIGGYRPDRNRKYKWVDGALIEAMRDGSILVLDEINLAESQVVERLNSLLDDDKQLVIHEKDEGDIWISKKRYDEKCRELMGKNGVDAAEAGRQLAEANIHMIHPDFRIIATMNPVSYAGRNILSPALMNRFKVKWIDEPYSPERLVIFGELFKDADGSEMLDFGLLEKLEWFHTQLRNMAMIRAIGRDEIDPYYYSLRDFLKFGGRVRSKIDRIEKETGMKLDADARREIAVREFADVYAGRLRDESDRAVIDDILTDFFGYDTRRTVPEIASRTDDIQIGDMSLEHWTEGGPYVPGEYAKLTHTNATLLHLERLAKAVLNNEHSLLVGPTGSAKTSLIRYLAYLTGNNFVRINLDAHTDTSDFIGSYIPEEERKGVFIWQDGLLIEALKKGHWVLLDELNLADPDILERINSLLDDEGCVVMMEHEGEKILSSSEFRSKVEECIKENGWESLESVVAERRAAEELARQGIFGIHPNFRLFAAMNPERYSGRNRMSLALRNKFSEMWVPNELDEKALHQIIDEHLVDNLSKERMKKAMAAFYVLMMDDRINEKFNGGVIDGYQFSMRDLRAWISYVNKHGPLLQDWDKAFVRGALYIYHDRMTNADDKKTVAGLLNGVLNEVSYQTALGEVKDALARKITKEDRANLMNPSASLVRVLDFELSVNEAPISPELVPDRDVAELVLVDSTIRELERVAQSVTLREPLLLIGETGAGKTSLIRYLAWLTNNCFQRFNLSGQTEKTQFLGGYHQDSEGRYVWRDGILVEALRKGYWLCIDEINLAPSQVIERMNSLLDDDGFLVLGEHRGEKFVRRSEYERLKNGLMREHVITSEDAENMLEKQLIFPIHENFRIFATMNPSLEAGRQQFSPALLNRFRVKWVDEPSPADVKKICKGRYMSRRVPKALVEKAVDFHYAMIEAARKHGDPDIRFTIRHLQRYLARVTAGESSSWESDAVRVAVSEGMAVYGDGLGEEDRALKGEIVHLLRKHFGIHYIDDQVDPDISMRHTEDELHIGPVGMPVSRSPRDRVVFGPSLLMTNTALRIAKKMMKALLMQERVLLVGLTGGGKSDITRYLSDLTNNNFISLDLDGQTDVEQLIGRYVPSEHGGNYIWKDGSLIEAMRTGSWILIDEINLADPDIIERINSLLDDDGSLMVSEHEGERWIPEDIYERLKMSGADVSNLRSIKKGFRIICAMNPEHYAGRVRMSAAMMNKFYRIWVPQEYDHEEEIAIIRSYLDPAYRFVGHIKEGVGDSYTERISGLLESMESGEMRRPDEHQRAERPAQGTRGGEPFGYSMAQADTGDEKKPGLADTIKQKLGFGSKDDEVNRHLRKVEFISKFYSNDVETRVRPGPGWAMDYATTPPTFIYPEKDLQEKGAPYIAAASMHEASHRDISFVDRLFFEKESRRFLANAVEDPRVNNWMISKVTESRSHFKKLYEDIMPENCDLSAKLPHTQFGLALIHHWAYGSYPQGIGDSVRKALDATQEDIVEAYNTIAGTITLSRRASNSIQIVSSQFGTRIITLPQKGDKLYLREKGSNVQARIARKFDPGTGLGRNDICIENDDDKSIAVTTQRGLWKLKLSSLAGRGERIFVNLRPSVDEKKTAAALSAAIIRERILPVYENLVRESVEQRKQEHKSGHTKSGQGQGAGGGMGESEAEAQAQDDVENEAREWADRFGRKIPMEEDKRVGKDEGEDVTSGRKEKKDTGEKDLPSPGTGAENDKAASKPDERKSAAKPGEQGEDVAAGDRQGHKEGEGKDKGRGARSPASGTEPGRDKSSSKPGEPGAGGVQRPQPYPDTQGGLTYREKRKLSEYIRQKIKPVKRNLYDRYYMNVAPFIHLLFGMLDNELARDRKFKYKGYYERGTKIDIKKAMVMEKTGDMNIWLRKLKGTQRSYKFCLVIDESGSMGGGSYDNPTSRSAMEALVLFMEVLSMLNIDFSLLGFSDAPSVHKHFHEQFKQLDKDLLLSEIVDYFQRGGLTDDAAAISLGTDQLEREPGEHKVMIVITDGGGNGEVHVGKLIDEARRKNIEIIGIGIGPGMAYVQDVYHPGICVDQIADLPKVLAKLLVDIIVHGKHTPAGYRPQQRRFSLLGTTIFALSTLGLAFLSSAGLYGSGMEYGGWYAAAAAVLASCGLPFGGMLMGGAAVSLMKGDGGIDPELAKIVEGSEAGRLASGIEYRDDTGLDRFKVAGVDTRTGALSLNRRWVARSNPFLTAVRKLLLPFVLDHEAAHYADWQVRLSKRIAPLPALTSLLFVPVFELPAYTTAYARLIGRLLGRTHARVQEGTGSGERHATVPPEAPGADTAAIRHTPVVPAHRALLKGCLSAVMSPVGFARRFCSETFLIKDIPVRHHRFIREYPEHFGKTAVLLWEGVMTGQDISALPAEGVSWVVVSKDPPVLDEGMTGTSKTLSTLDGRPYIVNVNGVESGFKVLQVTAGADDEAPRTVLIVPEEPAVDLAAAARQVMRDMAEAGISDLRTSLGGILDIQARNVEPMLVASNDPEVLAGFQKTLTGEHGFNGPVLDRLFGASSPLVYSVLPGLAGDELRAHFYDLCGRYALNLRMLGDPFREDDRPVSFTASCLKTFVTTNTGTLVTEEQDKLLFDRDSTLDDTAATARYFPFSSGIILDDVLSGDVSVSMAACPGTENREGRWARMLEKAAELHSMGSALVPTLPFDGTLPGDQELEKILELLAKGGGIRIRCEDPAGKNVDKLVAYLRSRRGEAEIIVAGVTDRLMLGTLAGTGAVLETELTPDAGRPDLPYSARVIGRLDDGLIRAFPGRTNADRMEAIFAKCRDLGLDGINIQADLRELARQSAEADGIHWFIGVLSRLAGMQAESSLSRYTRGSKDGWLMRDEEFNAAQRILLLEAYRSLTRAPEGHEQVFALFSEESRHTGTALPDRTGRYLVMLHETYAKADDDEERSRLAWQLRGFIENRLEPSSGRDRYESACRKLTVAADVLGGMGIDMIPDEIPEPLRGIPGIETVLELIGRRLSDLSRGRPVDSFSLESHLAAVRRIRTVLENDPDIWTSAGLKNRAKDTEPSAWLTYIYSICYREDETAKGSAGSTQSRLEEDLGRLINVPVARVNNGDIPFSDPIALHGFKDIIGLFIDLSARQRYFDKNDFRVMTVESVRAVLSSL